MGQTEVLLIESTDVSSFNCSVVVTVGLFKCSGLKLCDIFLVGVSWPVAHQ